MSPTLPRAKPSGKAASNVYPDHPPDPPDPARPRLSPEAESINLFATLAVARKQGNAKAVRALQQALRRCGWSVMAIQPAGAGGGRR